MKLLAVKLNKTARRMASLLLAAMLFVFGAAIPAAASVPDRPENNQYVLDEADVISAATEKELKSANQKLFKETGAEVVIVAVDFLGGEEIDDYAYDLFNYWGIGSHQRNNGLLLVMAVAEDNYYVEIGYGLEDYFTTSRLQDLVDDYLEPDFAKGDYDAGALSFFREAKRQLEDYYASHTDAYSNQAEAYTQGGTNYQSNYDDYNHSGYSGGRAVGKVFSILLRILIAVVVVVVFVVVIKAISGGGRGNGGGGAGGGGGGGFWTGMFLGNMMGGRRRYGGYRPPPPPGGFGGPGFGPRPPRGGGFGGFGGFSGGGRSGGGGGFRGGGGGFSGGGGSRGGGVGRR